MTSHELDSFQAHLLTDLRQHVATRTTSIASGVTRLDATTAPRRSRRKALAWVGGLAAACTAAAVIAPIMSAQPAYAVTNESGGAVHVQINRLEDASELQSELGKHGITADIQYLSTGMQCAPGRYTKAPSATGSTTTFTVGTSGIDVVIDRRDVPAGATVVISASRASGEDGIKADVGVAKGKVAACHPTPASR